jgi:hypothetical protein
VSPAESTPICGADSFRSLWDGSEAPEKGCSAAPRTGAAPIRGATPFGSLWDGSAAEAADADPTWVRSAAEAADADPCGVRSAAGAAVPVGIFDASADEYAKVDIGLFFGSRCAKGS